ncbi:MAG: tyrosine-type recombinase/integrase, partial [Candidatus Saccharimonadales bacterium]
VTIGRYPIISLAQARKHAQQLLAEHTLGKSLPPSKSYSQAVQDFLDDKAQTARPSTIASYRRHLNNFGFKGQLGRITHGDAARAIARIKAPSERSHALVAGKVFFNWCFKRRLFSENPLIGLSKPVGASRARILTDDELKAIWTATEAFTPFNSIIRFCLLTAQRRGEVALLIPADIQGAVCTIPGAVAKNRLAHAFPLTPLPLKLTAGRHNRRYVFSNTDKPFNNWGNAKAELDKASGTTDWTIHDIRRTVATRLAEIGVAPHIIERILNHISGHISGVAAVYNRARYLEEMRATLQLWEDRIQSLVG